MPKEKSWLRGFVGQNGAALARALARGKIEKVIAKKRERIADFLRTALHQQTPMQ